jgi:hypothetical protein
MPENEKRRFAGRWSTGQRLLMRSALENAEAIAWVEELKKAHLTRAFHASDLRHHAGSIAARVSA